MKLVALRPLETTWEDWVLGGGARAAFADPALPLEIEIGPGEDEFLLQSAVDHPDRNWLGIEYSRKRIGRYVRKTRRRVGEIGNLRLIWRPAADLVRPFLSPAMIETYHIYFPDPWPKKHHHRYRMLQPAFLRDLEASLVPGGDVRLLTDHESYAEEIAAAAAQVATLVNEMPDPGYDRVDDPSRHTVFERRWRDAGHTIFGIRLRKPAAA